MQLHTEIRSWMIIVICAWFMIMKVKIVDQVISSFQHKNGDQQITPWGWGLAI